MVRSPHGSAAGGHPGTRCPTMCHIRSPERSPPFAVAAVPPPRPRVALRGGPACCRRTRKAARPRRRTRSRLCWSTGGSWTSGAQCAHERWRRGGTRAARRVGALHSRGCVIGSCGCASSQWHARGVGRTGPRRSPAPGGKQAPAQGALPPFCAATTSTRAVCAMHAGPRAPPLAPIAKRARGPIRAPGAQELGDATRAFKRAPSIKEARPPPCPQPPLARPPASRARARREGVCGCSGC